MIRNGDVDLRAREEEIRFLKMEVSVQLNDKKRGWNNIVFKKNVVLPFCFSGQWNSALNRSCQKKYAQ